VHLDPLDGRSVEVVVAQGMGIGGSRSASGRSRGGDGGGDGLFCAMAIREVMGSAIGPAAKCRSRLRVSLITISS
jgi:hypothetical protein